MRKSSGFQILVLLEVEKYIFDADREREIQLRNTIIKPIVRERVCDAFELMGASFLLDAHDMGSCLFFWHKVADANADSYADANTKMADDMIFQIYVISSARY